jgi:molybdate transport system substrate-binding protein
VRPRRALAAAFVLMVAPGCGASRASTDAGTRLSVLAASSLQGVLPEIGTEFTRSHPGVRFDFSFAGTDAITAQIEQGAPADVFAGASTKYADQLAAEHLIGMPTPFCANRLVVVVPASNPAGIISLDDLATKDVKLVVGSETVPIGIYTRAVLGNLNSLYGPRYSSSVLAHVVSNETDVQSVLTKVSTGEADAGFVYVTDAAASGTSVSTIALPDQAQAVATYPAAVVAGTGNAAVAWQFVDFLRSSTAQAVLRQAGFGPAPQS